MVTTTVIHTYHGKRMNFGSKWFVQDIHNIMIRIADQINKITNDAATDDYKSKRGPSPPNRPNSFILQSFVYTVQSTSINEVTGIIRCGNDQAYYTAYVEEGHNFRGGKRSFEGHHFMLKGFETGKEALKDVISKEFTLAGYNAFNR